MKKILCLTESENFKAGMQQIFRHLDFLQADFIHRFDPRWKTNLFNRVKLLKKYDILYCFWAETRPYRLLAYRLAGVKIINHYIGSDLYTILQCPIRKHTPKLIANLSETLCVSELLQSELAEKKVRAKILPFTNLQLKDTHLIHPGKKTALVFLPENRKEFFKYADIVKLAEAFPNTEFTLFPFKKTNEVMPKNIKTVSYVQRDEMLAFYQRFRVFIRIPKHDGLPNTLLEAMLAGKWTIWSFNFPHTGKADNFNALCREFSELIEKREPNYEAAEHIKNNYSFPKIIENYQKYFQNI